MLGLAVLFLLIAILCFFFGGREAGSVALTAAKICGVIFVVLLLLGLVLGVSGGPGWYGWPVYYR